MRPRRPICAEAELGRAGGREAPGKLHRPAGCIDGRSDILGVIGGRPTILHRVQPAPAAARAAWNIA
jgi:hypothetical protein